MNEYDLADTEGLGKWLESPSHAQLREKMRKAIQAMSGRKYEIWTLLLQGKTQDEIAIILDISRSSVDTYYRRGIRDIRRLTDEDI